MLEYNLVNMCQFPGDRRTLIGDRRPVIWSPEIYRHMLAIGRERSVIGDHMPETGN